MLFELTPLNHSFRASLPNPCVLPSHRTAMAAELCLVCRLGFQTFAGQVL
jgi:hypothetical protein